MYTERLVDSVVGRARVVMTVSCVAVIPTLIGGGLQK